MRQLSRTALLLIGLAIAAAVLHAQNPSPEKAAANKAEAQAHAGLRATTRLVQINVVVRDKKGQPIEGLKAEDFTVLDDGKPQQITVFSSEAGSAIPRSVNAAASTLPPNVFSNRLDGSGQVPPNVTVILFDALNTPIEDQVYARKQIIKFIKELHPEDHAAIYLLTTHLEILHEFTQDTGELLATLNHYQGRFSSFLDAATPSSTDPSAVFSDMTSATSSSGSSSSSSSSSMNSSSSMQQSMQNAMQQFLNNADGALMDNANVNLAETTANALEAIAAHLARIPGRKSIVWVSGSFPIQIGYDADTLMVTERTQRAFTPELEHAAEMLNQASIAVYPVDARGLMTPAPYAVNNRNAPVNTRRPPPTTPVSYGPAQENFETMNMLADRTGGKAFYNNNDLEGAARAALADGQFSYVIGFYPNHAKWDGKFHELKVKVNAHGADVRYRKGYFATPDPPDQAVEKKAAVKAALWSPVDATGLGLKVAVKAVEPASEHAVQLDVGINIHELQLEEEKDGHRRGTVQMCFLQIGHDGKLLEADNKMLPLNLSDAQYQTLLRDGLVIVRHLPISPEATDVRILVRDEASASLGTVTVPLRAFLPQQAATPSSATKGSAGSHQK